MMTLNMKRPTFLLCTLLFVLGSLNAEVNLHLKTGLWLASPSGQPWGVQRYAQDYVSTKIYSYGADPGTFWEAGISVSLGERMGLRLAVAPFTTRVTGQQEFLFQSGPLTRSHLFEPQGTIRVVPLSLDLCLRFPLGRRSGLTLSSGPVLALIASDLTGRSCVCVGKGEVEGGPDYYLIGARYRRTFWRYGATIGFEFDYRFLERLSLLCGLNARFLNQSWDYWESVPGGYRGELNASLLVLEQGVEQADQPVSFRYYQIAVQVGVRFHL